MNTLMMNVIHVVIQTSLEDIANGQCVMIIYTVGNTDECRQLYIKEARQLDASLCYLT
ncbi:MAG: hypothetical protein MJZ34_14905 [Paludibacteraceae bacterium]|nr:hypothetical protein [Paludibacteraceae bacterium]